MPDIAHFLRYFFFVSMLTFVPFSCQFFKIIYLTTVNDWSQTESKAQRRVGLISWIFQSHFSWKWRPAWWSYMELLIDIDMDILSNGLCNRSLWKITCVDMELWSILVWISPGSNLQEEDVHSVASFALNSFLKTAVPSNAPPARNLSIPLSIHFFLYSLFLLPFSLSPALPTLCVMYLLFPLPIPSSLPPHPPLSPLPSVRRCGKRRVLSFPQCSGGCQCRRWTPSRQLCICWALWFTVWGHSPRTGNLWILSFWQPSPQVSF